MKIAAKTIHRPFWNLNVPGSLLRLILGEMAGVILEGSRISNSKLVASGFQFKYQDVSSALKEIYASKSK
jgi:NAD dependent epimerase/dehydratase family enzyme